MSNEEKYKMALELALLRLIRFEPGDSRAVSDEFVAMAAILSDANTADDCVEIVRNGIRSKTMSEQNSAQSEQVRVERALGGTTCLFCGEERSLKPNCTKQRWKVCNSHFMITCPICGHEAFWMEGMKSGDYYACFSLSCNWTDRVPPNAHEISGS